jgi:ferredoxin
MVDYDLCARCGRCVLGCPTGAKWDSRRFLREAQAKGARLLTGCRVKKLVIRDGKVTGVEAIIGHRRRFISGDAIVLAAGGLGTPVILQNSEISCEPRLFIDPVLCLAAEWKEARLEREIPMPFVVQREHFILSPYFDYLSYFFNRSWKPPRSRIVSLMIKLADTNAGTVSGKKIRKSLTPQDHARLREAVEIGTGILERLGIKKASIFQGTINAGHPGGMLPLTRADAETLHPARLPANVYVADATLFPRSLGNPPILTILALAKRVSRSVAARCS